MPMPLDTPLLLTGSPVEAGPDTSPTEGCDRPGLAI